MRKSVACFTIILNIFIVGCETINTHDTSFSTYQVNLISDPPGARIEVNDNYVGEAPLSINIVGSTYRTFVQDTTIRALPIYGGHCVQSKFFRKKSGFYDSYGSWIEISPADFIPQTIFFDTRLCKQPASIDVNVQ